MPPASIIVAAIAAVTAIGTGVASNKAKEKAGKEALELANVTRADNMAADRISRYLRERELSTQKAIGDRTFEYKKEMGEKAIGAAEDQQAWNRHQVGLQKFENALNSDVNLKNDFLKKMQSRISPVRAR